MNLSLIQPNLRYCKKLKKDANASTPNGKGDGKRDKTIAEKENMDKKHIK